MKNNPFSFVTIGILVGIFALPLTLVKAAPLTSATVTELRNDVTLAKGTGEKRAAAVDDVVSGSDMVQTGKKSKAEIEFKDKSIARLGANTIFTFDPQSRSMKLDRGVALIHVPPGGDGATISTPAATCGIHGDVVAIRASGDLTQIVALSRDEKGPITVTHPRTHQTRLLEAGQLMTIATDAASLPQPVFINVEVFVKSSLLLTGGAAVGKAAGAVIGGGGGDKIGGGVGGGDEGKGKGEGKGESEGGGKGEGKGGEGKGEGAKGAKGAGGEAGAGAGAEAKGEGKDEGAKGAGAGGGAGGGPEAKGEGAKGGAGPNAGTGGGTEGKGGGKVETRVETKAEGARHEGGFKRDLPETAKTEIKQTEIVQAKDIRSGNLEVPGKLLVKNDVNPGAQTGGVNNNIVQSTSGNSIAGHYEGTSTSGTFSEKLVLDMRGDGGFTITRTDLSTNRVFTETGFTTANGTFTSTSSDGSVTTGTFQHGATTVTGTFSTPNSFPPPPTFNGTYSVSKK